MPRALVQAPGLDRGKVDCCSAKVVSPKAFPGGWALPAFLLNYTEEETDDPEADRISIVASNGDKLEDDAHRSYQGWNGKVTRDLR